MAIYKLRSFPGITNQSPTGFNYRKPLSSKDERVNFGNSDILIGTLDQLTPFLRDGIKNYVVLSEDGLEILNSRPRILHKTPDEVLREIAEIRELNSKLMILNRGLEESLEKSEDDKMQMKKAKELLSQQIADLKSYAESLGERVLELEKYKKEIIDVKKVEEPKPEPLQNEGYTTPDVKIASNKLVANLLRELY